MQSDKNKSQTTATKILTRWQAGLQTSYDIMPSVRMAEWSKAPDSSVSLPEIRLWAFWSTYVGVGSNPTSDKCFESEFQIKIDFQQKSLYVVYTCWLNFSCYLWRALYPHFESLNDLAALPHDQRAALREIHQKPTDLLSWINDNYFTLSPVSSVGRASDF